MKRFLIFFLCFSLLFAPIAEAAVGSKGLTVLQGQKELVLKKGERKWLYVKDGFTKMPVLKGLCYYSDNTVVATVGLHSGVLRANGLGTAILTVSNNKGDCGVLTVRVVQGKKAHPLWLILLIPLFILFFIPTKKTAR